MIQRVEVPPRQGAPRPSSYPGGGGGSFARAVSDSPGFLARVANPRCRVSGKAARERWAAGIRSRSLDATRRRPMAAACFAPPEFQPDLSPPITGLSVPLSSFRIGAKVASLQAVGLGNGLTCHDPGKSDGVNLVARRTRGPGAGRTRGVGIGEVRAWRKFGGSSAMEFLWGRAC
jgi:hypothetical protein